jgi:hypothetical protein
MARLIDGTKHCASGGFGVGRYANGRIGADYERAIADERRLHGRRRRHLAGRAGRILAERGNALVVYFVVEKPGSPSVDTQYCKPVK